MIKFGKYTLELNLEDSQMPLWRGKPEKKELVGRFCLYPNSNRYYFTQDHWGINRENPQIFKIRQFLNDLRRLTK